MDLSILVLVIGFLFLGILVGFALAQRRQESPYTGGIEPDEFTSSEHSKKSQQSMLSEDEKAQIQEKLDRKRKIEAIQLYREFTSAGLKEAKEAIDAWERFGASLVPNEQDLSQIEQDVRSLLLEGKKIHAVKLYRNSFNSSLREAKDFVDNIEREMGMRR